MELLSIDFKGLLPSTLKNHYLLTVIDEYSRFPFPFACTSTNTDSVIQSLNQIFIVFGIPSYIHSDWGTSFLSKEVREYLTNVGIATSRTTSYHPQGNGQYERYNGIIWKHTLLALASRNLKESQWETVIGFTLLYFKVAVMPLVLETKMADVGKQSVLGTYWPGKPRG